MIDTKKNRTQCFQVYVSAAIVCALIWGLCSAVTDPLLQDIDFGFGGGGVFALVAVMILFFLYFPVALILLAFPFEPSESVFNVFPSYAIASLNGAFWGLVIMFVYRKIKARKPAG